MFPQHSIEQLGLWIERFFRLWCRNQWKRERYAPSFHLDDENLDPKTWCRFPILSGGYERELADLRDHLEQLRPPADQIPHTPAQESKVIQIQSHLTAQSLLPALEELWDLAGQKILSIHASAEQIGGTPVFTVRGRYVAQGWTEWTQGFQFGAPLLVYDATGNENFLELGRTQTLEKMAPHITHFGVHDHGFNQVSTYGNLWRFLQEGHISAGPYEQQLYELALKASGAVQAARWTTTADGEGFIYSFNGPHSLFCDTIRSLRALALAWRLGHVLWAENDRQICLLERLIQHARTTARHNVYYGEGRDVYDVRGTRRPRKSIQHERWQLSLSKYAARLFAIQHLDAGTGMDHGRLSGTTGVSADGAGRGVAAAWGSRID